MYHLSLATLRETCERIASGAESAYRKSRTPDEAGAVGAYAQGELSGIERLLDEYPGVSHVIAVYRERIDALYSPASSVPLASADEAKP